jgi:RNA recognition motif-containing protein
MSERSTVHVSGISSATTDKEVKDFFSFCGKITSISVTPVSGEKDATKSATVTFEKEA